MANLSKTERHSRVVTTPPSYLHMPTYVIYLRIEDILNCPLTYKPKAKCLRNRSSSDFEQYTTVRTLRYDQKSTFHETDPFSGNSQHHKLGLKISS